MITKNDLIASLKQNLYTEEKAIPIYAKHLNSAIFFSGFDKDLQEKIKNILLTLKKESEQHEQVFKSLISEIERSSKDVY